MILDLQFNLLPTKSDLREIEKWLIDEDKTLGEGFFCNWSIIERAYSKNMLITLNLDSIPIGFIVWTNGEIYAEIDILEIRSKHRNKGIGKYFFDQVSRYLKKKGFLAIKLFCEPRESEKFWKKMNFIKFPDTGYTEADLTYYKPLIETLKATELCNSENKIELWNVEPNKVKNHKPKWTWKIEAEFSTIIQPCNSNWNLKWTKNRKVIKEDKVKYFSNKQKVEYSPFLLIKELNEYLMQKN